MSVGSFYCPLCGESKDLRIRACDDCEERYSVFVCASCRKISTEDPGEAQGRIFCTSCTGKSILKNTPEEVWAKVDEKLRVRDWDGATRCAGQGALEGDWLDWGSAAYLRAVRKGYLGT